MRELRFTVVTVTKLPKDAFLHKLERIDDVLERIKFMDKNIRSYSLRGHWKPESAKAYAERGKWHYHESVHKTVYIK